MYKKNKVSFKLIPEQQQEQMENGITEVLQTIRKRLETLLIDKKYNHFFHKRNEDYTAHRGRREETKVGKDILQGLKDEDDEIKYGDEIEGITIMGKYEVKGARPMRVTLKFQGTTG